MNYCPACKKVCSRGECETCGSKAVVSEHAQWIGFTKWAEDALARFEEMRATVN